MAIAFRSISATVAVSSGNLTLTEPAGAAENDLLVADITARDNEPFTLPDGWGLVATQQLDGDTTIGEGAIASGLQAYIIRGASAPALVFTRTGGNTGFGRIRAYTGVDTASPYINGVAETEAVAAALVSTGGLTTGVTDCLLCMTAAMPDNTISASGYAAATQPTSANWTERGTGSTTTGNDCAMASADAIAAATATGALSYGMSSAAYQGAIIVGAFRPAGAGGGAQELTPSLYSDADSFHAPTIARGEVGLAPSLYTDADAFHAPQLNLRLAATLYAEADSFHAPSVARGAVALTPALYADPDTFFAPTLAPGPVGLAPALYADGDAFHAPQLNLRLAAGLYSDGDTFHAPTLTRGTIALAPALYSDADAFFAPQLNLRLSAALYTDADSFHAPVVAPGGVALAPALYSDADTFHEPVVQSGEGQLFPPLYVDADAFHAPTITRGGVALQPGLYADADTFYSPTVSAGGQQLSPELFSDGDTFFAPAVGRGGVALAPTLYADEDTFYAAAVTRVGDGGALAPALYVDADVFYSASIAAGPAPLAARPWILSGRTGLHDNPTPGWLRRAARWLNN